MPLSMAFQSFKTEDLTSPGKDSSHPRWDGSDHPWQRIMEHRDGIILESQRLCILRLGQSFHVSQELKGLGTRLQTVVIGLQLVCFFSSRSLFACRSARLLTDVPIKTPTSAANAVIRVPKPPTL